MKKAYLINNCIFLNQSAINEVYSMGWTSEEMSEAAKAFSVPHNVHAGDVYPDVGPDKVTITIVDIFTEEDYAELLNEKERANPIMDETHLRWAQDHDWGERATLLDGAIYIEEQPGMPETEFLTFSDLKSWAGY